MVVGYFISGFSARSSGTNPGVYQLADDDFVRNKFVTGVVLKREYDQEDSIVDEIRNEFSNDKIILIGHSLGGGTVLRIAQKLVTYMIDVYFLVTIEAVWNISTLDYPMTIYPNVSTAINLWSTSREGINGKDNVVGAINIGIDGTSHTDIDNNPIMPDGSWNPSVGVSNHPDYPGLPAWGIIKTFLGNLL